MDTVMVPGVRVMEFASSILAVSVFRSVCTWTSTGSIRSFRVRIMRETARFASRISFAKRNTYWTKIGIFL